ncbi:hypothetical protein BFP72_02725 [Reichenbachiella sp. 5M10]|uniref:hypothetical protein n=1 Tax=Reichenbachiella sp. 5M10 TaxID=1889772 RepID=UPI000C15E633|nr:hypothetical protein [Reichenbachiella sp. 5M10]PIB34409.1 hypothetical protein BFP72_02725 [Reichenbachiella sp. 5M10]
MKKEDIPQDEGPLKNVLREVVYAKDEEGKYTSALSQGWDVKKDALDNAWDDVNEKIEEAKQAVLNGEKSPVYYYKEKTLMDMPTITGYTGFWAITVKRHFKPSVFNKLSEAKLAKYAKAFDVTIEELKSPDLS